MDKNFSKIGDADGQKFLTFFQILVEKISLWEVSAVPTGAAGEIFEIVSYIS